MSPRVTIVTRTKNRPLLLARALQSVNAQTFRDYQHVIVDDARNPEPIERMLEDLDSEGRDKVLLVASAENTRREGVVYAGLSASHLQYLCIHDDDDTWEPRFLEKTVAWMDAHPEAGMVGVRCNLVKEKVEGTEIVELEKAPLRPELDSFTLLETSYANYVPPIAQLFRRASVDRLGFWDSSLATQADWEFNLRMLADSPAGFLGEEPLANWHHRGQSENELDNSVVSERSGHYNQNLLIRDSYLKRSLQQGDTGMFATVLAQQVWIKTLREEMNEKLQNAEDSRQSIHADLVNAILEQNKIIASLQKELGEQRAINAEILSIARGYESRRRFFHRCWNKLVGRKN